MGQFLIPAAIGAAGGAGVGGLTKGGKGAKKGALLGALAGLGAGGLGALGGAGTTAVGEAGAASATGAGSQLAGVLGAQNAAALAPTIAQTTVGPAAGMSTLGTMGLGANKALGALASPKGQAATNLAGLLNQPGQQAAPVSPVEPIAPPQVQAPQVRGRQDIGQLLALLLGGQQ